MFFCIQDLKTITVGELKKDHVHRGSTDNVVAAIHADPSFFTCFFPLTNACRF